MNTVHILLFALLCVAFAGPGPKWKPEKRKFDIHVNKDNVDVIAKYENNTYQDEFHFQVHLEGGDHDILKFKFWYQNKNQGNKTKINLNYDFNNIVEFISTQEVPYYQGNQTSVVQLYPTKGSHTKWDAWVNETAVIDGVTTYRFTASNGVLKVAIQMAASPLVIGTLPLDPNSVKLDFEILNFPYTATGSVTRLAILSNLKSDTMSKTKGSKAIHDRKIIFNDDPNLPLGAFSWVAQAQVTDPNNPDDVDVIAWTPEVNEAKDYNVYFTFLTSDANPHPTEILWDPQLGLDYSDETSGFCIGSLCDTMAYVVVAVIVAFVLAVVIGSTVFYLRRKKSQYQSL